MAGIGLTPSGPVVAENVRDLQRWARHARCTLGGRLVLGFTLRGHQRLRRSSGLMTSRIVLVATWV